MNHPLADMDEIVALRQRLHSLAEPSGEEEKTSAAVGDFLASSGADSLVTGIAGRGVLASFESGRDGPVTMFRAELDALPIDEQLSVEYASRRNGTSHKCGHDGHMAIVCGLSRYLGEHPPSSGTVHLLFQPAEETGRGARAMLDAPQMDDFKPDRVYALHNLPGFERGRVIVRNGVFAAGSTGFIARMRGATSHAAHPEQGNSPALAMSHLMQSLSAMPQFYVSLDDSAKVTVIHAVLGDRAFGTSPGKARVMATIRAYEEKVRDALMERAGKLSRGIAGMYGLEVGTEEVEAFPVTRNDPEAVDRIRAAASRLGLELLEREKPFGWSEDFGHFTGEYPGALFGLGSGTDHPSLHDGGYDFPDDLLETGIQIFAELADTIHGEGGA